MCLITTSTTSARQDNSKNACMNDKVETVYTVMDYLPAKVKFDIPKAAMLAILADRGVEPTMPYVDAEKSSLRLAYADIIKWFVVGHSKQNNTSDTDNGWTHSGGGYELDDTDRRILIKEANAIYDELEPASAIKNKTAFKIMSFGIRQADYDATGNPIPHIIR